MSTATAIHHSEPVVEPSYRYNEALMLAEIDVFKREQREALAQRMAVIDEQLEDIRAALPPKALPVPRRAAMPVRDWGHVPVILERHSLCDLSVLPHWARWCCYAVCAEYRIQFEDITRVSNKRVDVLPRRVAMFLMVRVAGGSLHKTGECLGGMHHTTVLAGVVEIERRRLIDHELNRRVDRAEFEARRHLTFASLTTNQQSTT